jgi:serine phosphatase RsbU (regulator of sigma subunit)
MLIKSEYDKAKGICDSPGEVFDRLNTIFYGNYKTLRMFFTGVIIDIDRNSRTLSFSSAGHPEQFLMRGERVIDLERTGRAVGISGTSRYETITQEYSPGDRLYLFTDGIFEEFDENREEFGADRLKKYIQANADLDAAGMIEAVMKMMTGYVRGGQANDDMTLIGIDLE